MIQKLKPIILAFAGCIVYSALQIVTPTMTDNATIATLITDIAVILLGSAYMAAVLKDFAPSFNTNRINPKFLIASLITVILFCFASMFMSNYILTHINDENFMAQQNTGMGVTVGRMLISIFLAPIVEEIVFRRFLYGFLSDYNKITALIVSASVFAAFHGTIVHLYAGFLGGIVFAVIYEKTHKLRYCIAAHMLFNGLTVLITMIPYPDFMLSLWIAVLLNIAVIVGLVCLWKMQAEIIVPKKVLTEEQKLERERISKIVDEVMSESKRH